MYVWKCEAFQGLFGMFIVFIVLISLTVYGMKCKKENLCKKFNCILFLHIKWLIQERKWINHIGIMVSLKIKTNQIDSVSFDTHSVSFLFILLFPSIRQTYKIYMDESKFQTKLIDTLYISKSVCEWTDELSNKITEANEPFEFDKNAEYFFFFFFF